MHTVNVVLNDADFHTAEQMAAAIDQALGAPRAHAVDSRRVEIAVMPSEDIAALLDKVEEVEIEVYPRARVVVNERTGTVVIGGTVRLQPVSILHGGLSVNVISRTEVSQPGALSAGTTQVVQQTTVQAQDKPVNRDRAERRRDRRGFGAGIAAHGSGSAGRDLDPAGHEGSRRARSRSGSAVMHWDPWRTGAAQRAGSTARLRSHAWCARRTNLKRR